MRKRFLIVLRHAPYGWLDAAEAVRHLNGAVANGLDATLLLLDDGVYLARAGQEPAAGWTGLASALEQALSGSAAAANRPTCTAFVHRASLATRGLDGADLVAGCEITNDRATADLLASADATMIY
ncbi:MAG: DsrE family protein [Chloroflexi bacterium]|nr:DsrE family protein [Chloroflexota bacterium]